VDDFALDRSKLLGFDRPSNLQAKVGDKATAKLEPELPKPAEGSES